MTNEAQLDPQDATIMLEGEDGTSHSCQILNVFEFENKEYALLLKTDEVKDKSTGKDKATDQDEGALVIMRLVERDNQSIFQTIESDDEFNRVVAHIQQLAMQEEESAS